MGKSDQNVKVLYPLNYTILLREIKEDKIGEIYCVRGLEDIIVNMSMPPKLIYKFNETEIIISVGIFDKNW